MPAQSRQLAAIMFTDIVGYTSRMGENEAATLDAKVKGYRKKLQVVFGPPRNEIQ